MRINSRAFGEIEVSDDKVITFANGIIGFPQLKHFTLLHDEEKGADAGIRFLQSIEEPGFAMPVMDPLVVADNYNPQVDEEILGILGNLTPDNILVMVTVTVPKDLTKMSVNLQGPIIVNIEEKKGCQIIIDSSKYPVKFPIYDILQARKAGE